MSFRDHRHEDVEPAAIPDSPHTSPRPWLTAKRALAIGAAVLAVVIIIVVVAFTLHTQNASQPSAASIDGPMPASPARDLVLAQADFPQAGGTFTAGPDRWATTPPSDSFVTMNSGSPLCRRLLTTANTGPAIDEQTASMDFSDGRYSAKVKKIADPSYDKDFDTIIAQCRNFSFTVDGGTTIGDITLNYSLSRLNINGVNGPCNGIELSLTTRSSNNALPTQESKSHILLGEDRGISYNVLYAADASEGHGFSPFIDKYLATMMNKQRKRILQAT